MSENQSVEHESLETQLSEAIAKQADLQQEFNEAHTDTSTLEDIALDQHYLDVLSLHTTHGTFLVQHVPTTLIHRREGFKEGYSSLGRRLRENLSRYTNSKGLETFCLQN